MTDEEYMLRAIELAKKGGGFAAPNPMVGAVIVKEGRIIGEGFHERCGGLHAERNAFASLKESAEGADMYVTLEPCCHYGRTPPCTEALIENKIARVFIGSGDPNPLVSGKGAALLRENGIEVTEGVMKKECDAINPVFFHYIRTKLPYVALKYAMTLDGKIATRTGKSKWITDEEARAHVHSLRGFYSAVLVGSGTALADDPMLNCRLPGAHQPLRVIVDSKLRLPLDCNICRTAGTYDTLVACAGENEKAEALRRMGITVVCLPDGRGRVDLSSLMRELGKMQISSVLIEGGGEIAESALSSGIVNHVYAYIAPKIFGGKDAKSPVEGLGIEALEDCTRLENLRITQTGEDILMSYDVSVKGGV